MPRLKYTIHELGGGGGALPIMDCTARLQPKGVPFTDARSIKG